jgi:adhesin/invasin
LLTNIITTVAGTGNTTFNGDNILAINANIFRPYGIRCDTVGNIYFSDDSNYRIRKITIGTNIITTIAGNGIDGYNGDNIKATDAQISVCSFLTIDTNGHVFFSDGSNHRIRKIDFFTRFFFLFSFCK